MFDHMAAFPFVHCHKHKQPLCFLICCNGKQCFRAPVCCRIKARMEMTASHLPPHPHLSSYSCAGHSPVSCWEKWIHIYASESAVIAGLVDAHSNTLTHTQRDTETYEDAHTGGTTVMQCPHLHDCREMRAASHHQQPFAHRHTHTNHKFT